jgi:hypothetical protein
MPPSPFTEIQALDQRHGNGDISNRPPMLARVLNGTGEPQPPIPVQADEYPDEEALVHHEDAEPPPEEARDVIHGRGRVGARRERQRKRAVPRPITPPHPNARGEISGGRDRGIGIIREKVKEKKVKGKQTKEC